MERFLWIASYFPTRPLFVLLAFGNGVIYGVFLRELVPDMFHAHATLWISVGIITLLAAICLAVVGGKAGSEYAEMGRSRQWNYRNTTYSRSDDTFGSTVYWAVEFALYPINVLLIVALVFGVKLLIPMLHSN